MSDRVAEHLCRCNFACVAYVLVNVRVDRRIGVVVCCVNGSILNSGDPGRISGCIVYVDWRSLDDMLIFKRGQYLPDLCNDLLYSGVRFLRKIF